MIRASSYHTCQPYQHFCRVAVAATWQRWRWDYHGSSPLDAGDVTARVQFLLQIRGKPHEEVIKELAAFPPVLQPQVKDLSSDPVFWNILDAAEPRGKVISSRLRTVGTSSMHLRAGKRRHMIGEKLTARSMLRMGGSLAPLQPVLECGAEAVFSVETRQQHKLQGYSLATLPQPLRLRVCRARLPCENFVAAFRFLLTLASPSPALPLW